MTNVKARVSSPGKTEEFTTVSGRTANSMEGASSLARMALKESENGKTAERSSG